MFSIVYNHPERSRRVLEKFPLEWAKFSFYFINCNPSFADLSLVDTNQVFVSSDATQNLDFGTLTTGESQSFDVVLKFNKGFKLSMSSVNSGRLKHATQNEYIGYTLTLNGAPITLTPTYGQVLSQTGTLSDIAGLRLPTQVTILTVAPSAPGGTYTDTVNIQVST